MSGRRKAPPGELDRCIRAHYPAGGFRAVQEQLPQYSRRWIMQRASELGITHAGRRQPERFSCEEEAIIWARYTTEGPGELAVALGRPESTIRAKAHQLGVAGPCPRQRTRYRLDAQSVAAIKTRLHQGEPAAVLARVYRVSPSTVYAIKNGHTWSWVQPAAPPHQPQGDPQGDHHG